MQALAPVVGEAAVLLLTGPVLDRAETNTLSGAEIGDMLGGRRNLQGSVGHIRGEMLGTRDQCGREHHSGNHDDREGDADQQCRSKPAFPPECPDDGFVWARHPDRNDQPPDHDADEGCDDLQAPEDDDGEHTKAYRNLRGTSHGLGARFSQVDRSLCRRRRFIHRPLSSLILFRSCAMTFSPRLPSQVVRSVVA